ncbi:UPF0149 family protein [Endozoicomonas sp. SM1973]|uniref:UPF0149 family protein n=1 Tax=Spartinivicinus marinus TaxID=2994442 RepID=A0A853I628_9GAMM|nr:UPF0149 family protein [Spartinivicinus marinus]MCX4026843.1 UPF0149 family protein [Spartinivicinus marinus]NYZ69370.1 UPF0149 family protein [Spartinivicinus marinus]
MTTTNTDIFKTDNPKIKLLLTMGELEFGNEWPDYIAQYGFTAEDISELLCVFESQQLLEVNDGPEMWAQVHAWRVLGQLRAEEAIEPILKQLESLTEDDDLALDELSIVLGLIGPAALEPLQQYWNEVHEGELCYEVVADALAKIVEFNPDTLDQVIEIYRQYLQKPIVSFISLNGILIGNILDLKAVELVDEVHQLFQLGCVDLTILGDFEEVELELGLRDKRKTPPLMWNGEELFISERIESNKKLAEIEKWLKKYADGDAIDSLSELDGFFTAIACSPKAILPSTMMPVLWGGHDSMPVFDSHKESEQVVKSLFDYYNKLIDNLESKRWQPIFKHYKNDTNIILVLDWCNGFLRGKRLWGNIPSNMADYVSGNLVPILYCMGSSNFPINARIKIEEVKHFHKAIEEGIKNVYQIMQQHRAVEGDGLTVARKEPKVGRNDPCPCGSGKKYKKCCGR